MLKELIHKYFDNSAHWMKIINYKLEKHQTTQ